MTPKYVAEKIVNGVLYNKMSVIVPEYYKAFVLFIGYVVFINCNHNDL